MTTDIKELVKRLREPYAWRGLSLEAADALEAMAGEVEKLGNLAANYEHEMKMATAERDRLKAALDIAKAHAKQNQRARDLVSPYPNDHAKRIVWERALYHDGKDLWDKLRKALGGDA